MPPRVTYLENALNFTQEIYTFKNRQDNFWQTQDIVYDFKAQIHKTEVAVCLIENVIVINL